MRLILIAALGLAATACSRSDEDRVRADTNAAGRDITNAAQNVKNDPAVRDAGDAARRAGHEAAVSVRKSAAEAEVKTGQAMIDAGDKAKRAAEQARADSSNQ
jgi:hypothetical protein